MLEGRKAGAASRRQPFEALLKNRLARGAGAGMLCPTKRMMTPAACVGFGALRGAVDNFSDRPQSRRTAEQRGGVDRQAQGRVSPPARQGQEVGTGQERSRCFCLGRIGGHAGGRATFRISLCGWSHPQAKAPQARQRRRCAVGTPARQSERQHGPGRPGHRRGFGRSPECRSRFVSRSRRCQARRGR